VRLEGLGQLKKIHLIGTRTRELTRRKVGSPILRRLEDAEDYIPGLEVTGWRKMQIIKKNAHLS
jgi:hypothetical protein